MASDRPRQGGLVGPLILIAVGAIFLLGNLGLLGWSAWEVIFRLWPLILVAVGLEILIGRRSLVGSLAVVVLVVALGAAAFWMIPTVSRETERSSTQSVSQSLENAQRADVTIAMGVGTLRMGAGSEQATLVSGEVSLGPGETLDQSFRVSGDTAYLRLGARSVGSHWPFGGGWSGDRTWDLKLSPSVPMQLKVDTGVGTSELDLSGLRVTELDADLGVGKASIVLPRAGRVSGSVDGGVGEVEVVVPEGVAARIRADAGLGGIDVSGNYQKQGDTYVSPGFDTAEDRVDLRIKGGVGRVVVRQGGSIG